MVRTQTPMNLLCLSQRHICIHVPEYNSCRHPFNNSQPRPPHPSPPTILLLLLLLSPGPMQQWSEPWRNPCCDLGCLLSSQTQYLTWKMSTSEHHRLSRCHSLHIVCVFGSTAACWPAYYVTCLIRLDYAHSSSVPAPISNRAALIDYF